jgi:PIN domain nuclease of toxin-antitoxin system
VRLLLDTAVLIFAAEAPERFSQQAAKFLDDPENILELSSVSVAEIAIKSTLGKLQLSPEAVHETIQDIDARLLPFTAAHAFQMFGLPLHHRDPFDRQIIAQAIAEQIAVVTPDKNFRSYAGVKVIW